MAHCQRRLQDQVVATDGSPETLLPHAGQAARFLISDLDFMEEARLRSADVHLLFPNTLSKFKFLYQFRVQTRQYVINRQNLHRVLATNYVVYAKI